MQKDNVKNETTNLLVNVFKIEKPIESQLPIVFKSGYTFDKFETKCDCCSATLKGEFVRGSLFKIEGNSRFEYWATEPINSENKNEGFDKIMVDAVGYCPQCVSYTPCQIHIDDKGLSPEEAEARELQIQSQKKSRQGKSFFGLNIEKTSQAKSMKNKRDKEILEAKKKAEEMLRQEEAEEKRLQEEIKKKTILAPKPAQNNDADSVVGVISENMLDMNEVVRHRKNEAIVKGSKAKEAMEFAAATAEAIVVKEPTLDISRRVRNLAPIDATPIVEAEKEVSPISQKLQEVIKVDMEALQNESALAKKAREQAEKLKARRMQQATQQESSSTSVSSAPVLEKETDVPQMILRGNRQPQKEIVPEVEKPMVRDTSSYVKVSRPQKKKYVQSSGSLTEKVAITFKNVFGIFGDVLNAIRSKRESKKNDILKNYKYVKPASGGGVSAADRLRALRENNEEFTRKPVVKIKSKKHNHDSFR